MLCGASVQNAALRVRWTTAVEGDPLSQLVSRIRLRVGFRSDSRRNAPIIRVTLVDDGARPRFDASRTMKPHMKTRPSTLAQEHVIRGVGRAFEAAGLVAGAFELAALGVDPLHRRDSGKDAAAARGSHLAASAREYRSLSRPAHCRRPCRPRRCRRCAPSSVRHSAGRSSCRRRSAWRSVRGTPRPICRRRPPCIRTPARLRHARVSTTVSPGAAMASGRGVSAADALTASPIAAARPG